MFTGSLSAKRFPPTRMYKLSPCCSMLPPILQPYSSELMRCWVFPRSRPTSVREKAQFVHGFFPTALPQGCEIHGAVNTPALTAFAFFFIKYCVLWTRIILIYSSESIQNPQKWNSRFSISFPTLFPDVRSTHYQRYLQAFCHLLTVLRPDRTHLQ